MRRYPNVRTGPLGNRMIALVERYYPKVGEIYVTSGTDGDHGGSSHHYGLSYQGSPTAAIDFGGGGVTPEGSRRMRDFAKWLYDLFWDLTVEEVHTTPYRDDQGFYVKNQVKRPNGGGIYGTATKEGHRNHVHWATSAALMTRIEQRCAAWAANPAPTPLPPSTDVTMFIDVSHHDWDRLGHGPDWSKIVAGGLGTAALIRATYGDPAGFHPASPHFADMAAAAKAAGVRAVGGYHNLIKGDDASVARQVDFHRAALDAAGCLFGMCDVEQYPELQSRGLVPDWDTVRRFNDRWDKVEPDRVMAWYVARWIWSALGQPDLRALVGPLINADYPATGNAPPADIYPRALAATAGKERGWAPYGRRTPDLWQFTSTATVDGASGTTDCNAFRGSADALVKLFTDDDAPSGVTGIEDLPMQTFSISDGTDAAGAYYDLFGARVYGMAANGDEFKAWEAKSDKPTYAVTREQVDAGEVGVAGTVLAEHFKTLTDPATPGEPSTGDGKAPHHHGLDAAGADTGPAVWE